METGPLPVELRYKSQKVNTEPTNAIPVGVATEPEVVESEEVELVEEMAASAVINETFNEFIANVAGWFEDLRVTSEESNPVRTHLEIVSLEESVITEAFALRDKLLADLAQRGEEIPTKGGSLHTQIIDVDAEEN
jgi:hypothetical protein